MEKLLTPRSKPIQERAHRQRENILNVTSKLLLTVGIDELTTILVAKKVGISVGTLYHYFPNKQAILYALSEIWIENILATLEQISSATSSGTSLKRFVSDSAGHLAAVYADCTALLPLVHAMEAIPELKPRYKSYYQSVCGLFSAIFKVLDVTANNDDGLYIAGIYWDLTHSVLSSGSRSAANNTKALADLKYLQYCLLERAKSQF